MAGKVWLVGAGPGDPGLLTLKGFRLLQDADVVVYDRLVNTAILDHAGANCERLYAGKSSGESSSQGETNELLVKLARDGKRVVRLKGGDPFVFGRGGEEAEALVAAGIPFEVVPGVSSALAAPAYAGIPVSQRGAASSFAVFTGHEDASKAESSIHWSELATGADTLVCLMGVRGLGEVAERLIEAGRSRSTPAAVISRATLPAQRVVTGVLGDIAERSLKANLEAPAVAVFGDVVRMRERLQWFETRPLFGERILVTRTREQSSSLRWMLEEEGAEVLELPTLQIVDGASPQLLDRVINALSAGEYAWVVFTSANGVRRFFRAVEESGADSRAFYDSKVAVVGPATAEALAQFGIRADLMPEQYDGGSLAALLSSHELARRRVLVPRAEAARTDLLDALRARGAEVEEVPLYRSDVPNSVDPSVRTAIATGKIDVVTFASSSAVRNLTKMLGDEIDGLRRAFVACIGPITAETAERCGFTVGVVAQDQTIPGLVRALRDHFLPNDIDGTGDTELRLPSRQEE